MRKIKLEKKHLKFYLKELFILKIYIYIKKVFKSFLNIKQLNIKRK